MSFKDSLESKKSVSFFVFSEQSITFAQLFNHVYKIKELLK